MGPVEPGPICGEGSLQYNPNNSNTIRPPICNTSRGSPGVFFRKILSSGSCIQNLKDAFQSLRVIYRGRLRPGLGFGNKGSPFFNNSSLIKRVCFAIGSPPIAYCPKALKMSGFVASLQYNICGMTTLKPLNMGF